MHDPVLDEFERKERLFLVRVLSAGKVITWTTLLLLVAIIEAALVIKVLQVQFGWPGGL